MLEEDLLPFEQSWNVGQERIIFTIALLCPWLVTWKRRALLKIKQASTELRSSQSERLDAFLHLGLFSALYINTGKIKIQV